MSGPIVRKYGFPNHEQIFGRRPLEHGAEEPKKGDGATEAGGQAKDEKSAPPRTEPPRD